MGLMHSITPEEKTACVVSLHEDIEKIMTINSQLIANKNKKFIEKTYRSLMKCAFHEQVTDARLLHCLNKHVDEWIELNNILLMDKNKYVMDKYTHMKQYLNIYMLEVLRHED